MSVENLGMKPLLKSSIDSFPSSSNSEILLDATGETPFALSLLAHNALNLVENRFVMFVDELISGIGEAMSNAIDETSKKLLRDIIA